MAKINTTNRAKGFKAWIRRHKVLTTFTLILALGLIWFLVISIQWDLQIRAERQRFEAIAKQLNIISRLLPASPLLRIQNTCTQSNFGGLLEADHIGCGTNVSANYKNVSIDQGKDLSLEIKQSLLQHGLLLKENKGGYSMYDIGVYTFLINGQSCGYSTTYYNDSVSNKDRDINALSTGDVLFVSIGCSGSAKTNYFPIVQN